MFQAHLGYAPEEWALFEKMKTALQMNQSPVRHAYAQSRARIDSLCTLRSLPEGRMRGIG